MLFPGQPGLEIDIGQGVQLGEHNVDVVGAHPRGNHRDTLALVGARVGDELAVLLAHLHRVQHTGYHRHTAGIAHQNDIVGQFLRVQVEMVNRAVGLQRQLGSSYLVVHILSFLSVGKDTKKGLWFKG